MLVELQSGQFRDLVALCKSTVLVSIDDGKADLTSQLPSSLNKTRLRQFAVVAPFCSKHNEPDLVAAQNHVVIGLIIKSDQVAVAVLGRNVSIRDILPPESLNAELFDIVAFALGDEILYDLLAILERKHLDERRAVDSEVIAKLGAGRYIHSTVIDLVVTALKICSDSFELRGELLGVRAPRDVEGDKPQGIISRLDFLDPIGVC